MVGKVVFDGDCKDCNVSDLSIQQLYSNSGARVNYVVCSHENACRHMKLKYIKEKGKDKNDV